MSKNRLRALVLSLISVAVFFLRPCFAEILADWQDPRAYKPAPVLFVHGFGKGSSQDWEKAKLALGRYFSKYSNSYTYLEAIDFNDPNGSVDTYDIGKLNPQGNRAGWADKLKDKIDGLLLPAKYGAYTNRLNLVSHSMGGLAARWYLANYNSNTIDKLILMGVPNKGSSLATAGNALSIAQKIGWLSCLTTLGAFTAMSSSLLDAYLQIALTVDRQGEAVDDMDPWLTGSGFIDRLNRRQQPADIDYFGIIGIEGNLLNWAFFGNWYGGDGVVPKDSQLGINVVSLRDSLIISASHWQETEAVAAESENKILKFLDSSKPELEINSPDPTKTTEISEPSIHITGKVYREYLPADSKLIINVTRLDDGYRQAEENSFLKASDLWIPDNLDSAIAEFDEVVNFPGSGTYQVSCQVMNPAGVTSDIKTALVKVSVKGAYLVIHCHNPEGKEIGSIIYNSRFMRVWFYVAINDNDREIGERRYEPTTHNAAVNLEPGFHRITAEFNGIVLIQEVTLAVNEVKTLIFTFERATFDFRTYLDSIGTVSRSASGYLSYPPSPYDSWNIFSLDTGTTYPFMEQGLAIHIFDRQPISLSTTGYAEMSISSSGIKHRVWAETTVTGGSKPHPYYTIGMNASFTWWNPGSMPIYRDRTHGLETNAFRWWFIQNKAILGFVPPEQRSHFEVSGNEIIDYNFDRVVWFDANAERELKIWSKSPCFYVDGYGTAIYQESVPTSFYFSKVYLVSIPYDLSDMAN